MIYHLPQFLFLAMLSIAGAAYKDIPCMWTSKTGVAFNLQPLMVTDPNKESYFIADGDIPCTVEVERTYSFMFNFCHDITAKSFPVDVCNTGKMGSAIQFYHRASDNYKECNIIGHYDPERDDTYFHLLDERDPSKGVSMTYLYGDKCPNGQLRTTTIDVACSNTKVVVDSALEPDQCNYHVVVNSWHGCPQVIVTILSTLPDLRIIL